MKRNALVFIALVVAIMAMLAFGKFLDHSRQQQHTPPKLVGNIHGASAPDFSLTSLDGSQIKLSDFRGKAVLLNFWATWCPPCKVEMPLFEEFQKEYGKDGLVVLGVAMDDSEPARIAKFVSDLGVNYPVLLGTNKVSDDYGDVQYLPTTFYIGRDGAIVEKMAGLPDVSMEKSRKQIEDAVKKALSTAATSPGAAVQHQARVEAKASNPNRKEPQGATR